jgi:hypothetical protein
MPDPLAQLEGAFADGSAWDPEDTNAMTVASQRFQDAWEVAHDEVGYHVRALPIPIESAFVHWDGANYTITEQTADGTWAVVANPAVGFIELSVAAMINTNYTPMVDVVPSGTEACYFYEDANFAKTTTNFQIALFNDTGAFVDRDFEIHIIGTRL